MVRLSADRGKAKVSGSISERAAVVGRYGGPTPAKTSWASVETRDGQDAPRQYWYRLGAMQEPWIQSIKLNGPPCFKAATADRRAPSPSIRLVYTWLMATVRS